MPRSVPDLKQCRADARRLFTALHSSDATVARAAAERFRTSPPWKENSTDEILQSRRDLKLKHALAVVAREHGHRDWKSLKDAANVAWYPRGSAFLNAWYASYSEARACLEKHGGYLLTHRGKYFVCEGDLIRALGLDPEDPRWERIGRDVARPKDRPACEELRRMAQSEAQKPYVPVRCPNTSRYPRWLRQ